MTVDALKRTLDDQRRASDPATSSWVAANAGAGKTTVLVNRVVRLMLDGTPPARILCLTFTKAAAAEMSNRIFKQLGEWSILDDAELGKKLREIGVAKPEKELEKARLLFAKALETPGGLKIQTIHAFCQSILGRFPLEAGVVPQFQVLDDYNQSVLLAQAQDEFLDFAASDGVWNGREAWQQIMPLIGERAIQDLITEISNRRFELAGLTKGNLIGKSIGDAWQRLGFDEPVSPQDVVDQTCADTPALALKKAIAALHTGSDADAARGDAIGTFLEIQDRPAFWSSYQSVFLTQKAEPRKSLATKSVRESFPAEYGVLCKEQDRVLAALECQKAAIVGQLTEAMLYVAEQIIDRYERLKRLDGVLDYDDLIKKTADMLSRANVAAWVLFKLDGGIDHILVDEAQDTNPLQWTVIQKIADEFFAGEGASSIVRTIFAVGDEKQSIYSFQGADPAEFDRQRSYFEQKAIAAERAWSPVDLILSFRSTVQVLQSVDAVFDTEDMRRQLTAAASPVRHEAERLGHAGRIELWPVFSPDEEDEDDPWDAPVDRLGKQSPPSRLAEYIAQTISTWLKTGERLPSKGRAIRPSDIFILVRRRNRFVDELIRRLKIGGVPVAGIDRMVLTEQIAVMDLMALASFALLPEDDLTLATVLRSPLVDLTEEELFELAYDRPGTIWQALGDKAGDTPRFAEARDLLSKVLAMADMVPPFEFFSRILTEFDGRIRLVARLGPDAQDPIDEFIAMALDFERREIPSLQGFLDWIEQSNAEIKRDLDHGRNEVRIMTVHGAKGLEANIVFLPDTCGVPSGQHDARLLTLEPDGPTSDGPLFWVPSSGYDVAPTAEARSHARAKRDSEFQRLLYVAMTRASDRLYICGYEGAKKRAAGCWYDAAEAAIQSLGDEVQLTDGMTVWRIDGAQNTEPKLERRLSGDDGVPEWRSRFPDWITTPAVTAAEPTAPLSPSRLGGADEGPPVLSPVGDGGGNRFKRGRLIHRLLELLPETDAPQRRDAALRFLSQAYLELSPDDAQALAEETLGVLNDPAFEDLFGPGSRAEVPLVGQVTIDGREVSVNGQVDRLLIKDDRVAVIDFKTNRPPPEKVDQVSVVYLRQMAVYRRLLQTLFPRKTVDCALLWTDGPRLMALPGPLLDAAFDALEPV